MASGTPCLNSRWDRPKPKDPLQDVVGNESRAVPCHVTPAAPGTSSPAPLACDGSAPPQGGVELAAAMAAKINAMLMAKGKLKPLQPLPSKAAPAAPDPDGADELVMAEVDINDVPMNCRDLLTKGKTQEEIRQFSGAVVSTKGLYMSDTHKSSSTGVARPLYLHVQGRSQEEVNKAVIRIKEIISEDILRSAGGQKPPVMPTVPVYRQPPTAAARPTNTPAAPGHKPPPPHSGSFVHTKIFVGLDQCHPSFNVNERVEGPSGSYLQHIQTETGARVFLRGKGSGYIEQASRRESFEPLYLYISHPNAAGLESARRLCTSLLETVRGEHARMMSTFAPAASAAVYPTAGYSAASQSWYSYSSSYSSYPDVSGYWKGCSGPAGQSQLSSSPVQYPVCSRKPSSFILQEDDAVSDGVSSPSGSPKRHFSEEEQKAQIEASADVCLMGSDGSVDSSSERTLMPPPSAPVTAVIRKRVRDETSSAHTAEQQLVKKNKLQDDCGGSLGLVPYGGDSSDEEEERTRSGNKSTV